MEHSVNEHSVTGGVTVSLIDDLGQKGAGKVKPLYNGMTLYAGFKSKSVSLILISRTTFWNQIDVHQFDIKRQQS